MKGAALALFVCAGIHSSRAESYTLQMYSRSSVSVDGLKYGYTITASSASVFSGDPSLSGSTYSINSGASEWYQTAVAVGTSDLPSTFQSVDTSIYGSFSKVGPLLYRKSAITNKPDVVYFGGATGDTTHFHSSAMSRSIVGAEFTCTATTAAVHTGFTCSDKATTAQVAVIGAPVRGELWTISAEISSSDSTIVALMAMLATNLQTEREALDTISEAASDRRSNGQSYSVGLYFVGTCSFLALVVQGVVCCLWLWQPLGKDDAMQAPDDPSVQTRMLMLNTALWGGSTAVVVVILMSVWRFPALLAFGMFLMVFVAGVSTLYAVLACIRYRKHSQQQKMVVPEEVSEPNALINKQDSASTSEPAKGSGSGQTDMSEPAGAMGTPPTAETEDKQTIAEEKQPIAPATEDQQPLHGAPTWQSQTCPNEVKSGALRAAYVISGAMFVLLLIIEVGVFFGWSEKPYYVWDRGNNEKEVEFQPSNVAKALLFMYSFDSLATDLNYNVFCDISTTYCEKYIDDLGSDRSTIQTNWIDKYNIDMSMFSPTSYEDYISVNEWFIRHLAAGARPISNTTGSFVAAADGRLMVFTNIWPSTRFWIKSSRVDTIDILDSTKWATYFNGGDLAIYRLAPQDYHRFHSPVAGTIVHVSYVTGTLFSVSADAATSKNAAFLNQRHVVIIDSPEFGKVAYVAVGATCVGSTVITRSVGATITKGEELGYMQFGGSTIVLIFESGKATFDADLTYNTAMGVETHVLMGEHNGLQASG